MKNKLTKKYIKNLVDNKKWKELYLIEYNLYVNRTLTSVADPEFFKKQCDELTKDIFIDVYCQRNNIDTKEENKDKKKE